MTQIRRHIAVAFALFMMILTSPASFAAQAAPVQVAAAPAAVQAQDGVNINTADAETLAKQLNGVGINKAQAIVDYRAANGAFTSADDLINVKGIGAATVEKNAAIILVK